LQILGILGYHKSLTQIIEISVGDPFQFCFGEIPPKKKI